MRIDLHCHTLSVKSGENAARNVEEDVFEQKISAASVEIVAITNHNKFDLAQFNTLESKVGEDCQLWSGVELDVKPSDPSGSSYHMLVISNPSKAKDFSDRLAELTQGQTPETFVGDAESIIEKFKECDCLFLPHFHKKPAISESEIEKIRAKLTNENRLILESQNITSMGIFINHGMSSIVGSDINDWSKYPDKELPELRLRVDSYEQFCKLLDKDPVVVKTLLDKKTHDKISVNPCEDNREEAKEDHYFYHDINIIMGDKGTGKTEVIKSLKKHFGSQSISCSTYISGETTEELKKELKTDDMERSAAKIGIDNCVDDFGTLKNWGDKQPKTMGSYVEYHKSKTNKERQKRIQWSKSKRLGTSDTTTALKKLKDDLQSARNAQTSLDEIDVKVYLGDKSAGMLGALLAELVKSVETNLKQKIIEDYAISLTNFTLDKFKNHTAAKTNTAPKPDNTGFEEYANNRLALDNAISNILAPFNAPSDEREHKDHELMGSIGEKGKIFLERRYRLLNDESDDSRKSKHDEFKNNITDLRDIKEQIDKISKNVFSTDQSLFDGIEKMRQLVAKAKVESLDDFVGIFKQTVDNAREPYHLSNGERSILYIQRAINDDNAEVYLLDEPELSMANSYIDEVIRPRIIDLGRKNKMVIMATHNANLAVRTLPYTTMYRYHGSAGYKTYMGNPFTNDLVNMKDETDKLGWRAVSMKILEGGKEAFNDRKEIYG